jgi:hypothetical protein
VAFHCYIDEAGDDGIDTGGTRWSIRGAVIARDEVDLKTSEIVPGIVKRLERDPKDPLRWSTIRKHDKRVCICSELLTGDWAPSSVVDDKTRPFVMNASGPREEWNLYFYSTRLLLQRLSWHARDNDRQKARLTPKERDMSYDALRQ